MLCERHGRVIDDDCYRCKKERATAKEDLREVLSGIRASDYESDEELLAASRLAISKVPLPSGYVAKAGDDLQLRIYRELH